MLYAPFYMVAIYAFKQRKEWIRLPCIVYSVAILSTCFLIVVERSVGILYTLIAPPPLFLCRCLF